jgi:A1 cistron-splicing factor AAR2
VLLSCQAALGEVQGFFVEVVRVLAMQVRHFDDVEGGMFEMRDEGGSAWLRSVWGRFRAVVEDAFSMGQDEAEGKGKGTSKVGEQGLKKEVENLQRLFEEKYGWASEKDVLRRGMLELEDGERIEVSMAGVDEDEETGEYAPLIVDT